MGSQLNASIQEFYRRADEKRRIEAQSKGATAMSNSGRLGSANRGGGGGPQSVTYHMGDGAYGPSALQSGLTGLAAAGDLEPLSAFLRNMFASQLQGRGGQHDMWAEQDLSDALKNAGQPKYYNNHTPGSSSGGYAGGISRGGSSSLADNSNPWRKYQTQEYENFLGRQERTKDLNLEAEFRKRDLQDRIHSLRSLLSNIGQEHATTTRMERQGGNLVPVTERVTKDRDITSILAQIFG